MRHHLVTIQSAGLCVCLHQTHPSGCRSPITPSHITPQDYVAKYGRLPQHREEVQGVALGRWVTDQRTLYRQGVLDPECVAALEAVPMFSWEPLDEFWVEHMEALRAYVAEFGALPKKREQPNGVALGEWVQRQRKARKNDTLAPEKVAALEALPCWQWSGR